MGAGTRGRQASAIGFDRVSKAFPGHERPAVNDVSLTVEPGRFVVLLGPSGSGKTTLLKLVNRLYDPTDGRVTVDGIDIRSLAGPRLRRRIGYVIQQTGLFPHMRVEENIAVVPKLLRWDRCRIDRRVDELLDLVGLPVAYRRRYPVQLSGGEQQRVGIARALAGEPTTLLMDEPFGALDAVTRKRLQAELRAIHHRLGQTVLFVTHDVEEALRLADRIVILREGRVVQHDVPLRILAEPADAGVAALVGADDALRRLGLLPVGVALRRPDRPIGSQTPTVPSSASLRSALNLLLTTGAPELAVASQEGELVGVLDLADVQAASAVGAAGQPVPSPA